MDRGGMCLRKTKRKNGDGSFVRYLQMAGDRRGNGTTQAEVLVNLVREDELDVEALRRLVASINPYLGDDGDLALPRGAEAGPPSIEESRPVGSIWLLNELWRAFGERQGPGQGAVTAPVSHRRRAGDLRAGRQPGPWRPPPSLRRPIG